MTRSPQASLRPRIKRENFPSASPIHQTDNAIADAVADLGKPEEIGKVFVGFQKYLYEKVA